jgi:hypothetical protein
MVALDTLKVAVSRDVLRGFDEKAFTVRRDVDPVKVTDTETLRLHPRIIKETCGLGAVEIGRDRMTVEMSAKILGEKYPAGITLETVERIPRAINEAGAFQVDAAAFLDGAEVLRCDVAVNLPVQDVQESLRHLHLLGVNDRYHTRAYERDGIVFTREAKTAPERLTFYDKFGEMTRGKNRRWIERGILDAEPFRGMLRGEVNLKNFRGVRNFLGVQDPRSLLDILSSDRNPVLAVFERVANHPSIEQAAAGFRELCNYRGGYAAVKDRIGNIGVFKLCDWEWSVIRVYIKGTYSESTNPSPMLRKVKSVFVEEDRKRRERERPEVVQDRIAEIHQLLRKAA